MDWELLIQRNDENGGGAGSSATSASEGKTTETGKVNTPPPAPPSGGTAAVPAWKEKLDPELRKVVDDMKWDEPHQAVEGYQHARKLLGAGPANLLRKPKDEKDIEGFLKVMDAVGRPPSAKDYAIPLAQNASDEDKTIVSKFQDLAHAEGLTKTQATNLYGKVAAINQETEAQRETAWVETTQKQMEDLAKEKGEGLEEFQKVARRAAVRFGVNAETADKLDRAFGGPKGALEFLFNIGSQIAEDGFEGADGGAGKVTLNNPVEAQKELDAMKEDPEVRAAMFNAKHPRHKEVTKELDRLSAIAGRTR